MIRSPKLSRRLVLTVVAALAVGWGVREYRLIPEDYGGGQLSVSEAHQKATDNEILLIDIRTPGEWGASGIAEGAIPLDMRRTDFIDALTGIAAGRKTRPIALICARGVRSARLSNMLTQAGFSMVLDVPEGMLGSRAGPGWVRSGLPVRKYYGETG